MRAMRARDDFSSSVLAHRAVSRVGYFPAPVSSLHLSRLRFTEGEVMNDEERKKAGELAELLCDAFPWKGAPQGEMYWWHVYISLRELSRSGEGKRQ